MSEHEVINFGALPPMPPECKVIWCEGMEMYLPIVNGEEGPIYCNRFDARRAAIETYKANQENRDDAEKEG